MVSMERLVEAGCNATYIYPQRAVKLSWMLFKLGPRTYTDGGRSSASAFANGITNIA